MARSSIPPDEPSRAAGKGAADIHRRNGASKRKLIIEAGKRVIFREGIWNATTRKIAEEAAINLATIHYHFSSKEALLIAIFEEMIHSVRASARADFDRPSSLAERIDRAVTLSWDYSARNLSGQIMQSELTLYALRTEGMAWLARRQLEEYLDIYLSIFRGASDIARHGNLDLKGLSRLVVAGIDGILLQHYVNPDTRGSSNDCKKLIYLALRYPLSKGVEPITALSLGRRANGKGRRRGASP